VTATLDPVAQRRRGTQLQPRVERRMQIAVPREQRPDSWMVGVVAMPDERQQFPVVPRDGAVARAGARIDYVDDALTIVVAPEL
jgi:hypothetical protein